MLPKASSHSSVQTMLPKLPRISDNFLTYSRQQQLPASPFWKFADDLFSKSIVKKKLKPFLLAFFCCV